MYFAPNQYVDLGCVWYMSAGLSVVCCTLSQYVNLAKTLPCLSLLPIPPPPPPPLPETSLYFALFAPRLLPIDPLPVQFRPHKFLRSLLFCGFLLCLISGLNHPLAPQIWRWGGGGLDVRVGNDGTQSTKLEDGIQSMKHMFRYIGQFRYGTQFGKYFYQSQFSLGAWATASTV